MNVQLEIEHIITWVREYFAQNGPNSKAIIGISGGKDSSITAALLVRALGPERVIAVKMPQGEQKDIDVANDLIDYLGVESYEVNIGTLYTILTAELYNCGFGHKAHETSAHRTNTPSRLRMTILYAVAAMLGGRVVNTCNLSEDYIGFSTKYGDLAGDFGVLKQYTVREIKQIGHNLLPARFVDKVPSDGMCGKTDEEAFGFTYEDLDSFLLEGKEPIPEVQRKIAIMHERNLHKENIQIPSPTPLRGTI